MDVKLNKGAPAFSAEVDKFNFRQEKVIDENKLNSPIEQSTIISVAHKAPIVRAIRADQPSESMSVTTTSAERISSLMQSQKVIILLFHGDNFLTIFLRS